MEINLVNFELYPLPTEKQLVDIELIENNTRYKFTGHSKYDVCEFIKEHIEESKRLGARLYQFGPWYHHDESFYDEWGLDASMFY